MSTKVALAKLDVDLVAGVAVRLWFARAKARRRVWAGLVIAEKTAVLALSERAIDLVCHGFHEVGQGRALIGGDMHLDRDAGLQLISAELGALLVGNRDPRSEVDFTRDLIPAEVRGDVRNWAPDLRSRLLVNALNRRRACMPVRT